MERVLLTGLMKLELPTRAVTLCDGGFVRWNGDLYQVQDAQFGMLTGFNALTEGVGDEAPAGTLTMVPPSTTAAALLTAPCSQGARLRLWIAEVEERTGGVIGQPDQMVDWQVDSMRLRIARGTRLLEIGCVAHGQRLMLRNEGNNLSSSFHRLIYSGEAGLDNATGLTTDVAWGAATPPRGAAAHA